MARRPPADLDLVNQFYDRWAPYEGRRRDISDDLKELFAEAKGNGLNPKALRAAFAEKYRIDNQTSDEAEKRLRNDDDFELYMQALARVRESDDESDPVITTTNASVPVGFDPETGEEITTEIDRLKIEPLTHTAAPSPQVVQADHGGESDDTALAAGPDEPEHGTVSSGDYQREPASVPLVSEPLRDADAQRLTAGPFSEPGNGQAGAMPVSAGAQSTGNVDGSAGRSHSSLTLSTESTAGVPVDTHSNITAFTPKPLRPWCQQAHDLTKCGGYGRVHCSACQKLKDAGHEPGVIAVEAGGVQIKHQGIVQ